MFPRTLLELPLQSFSMPSPVRITSRAELIDVARAARRDIGQAKALRSVDRLASIRRNVATRVTTRRVRLAERANGITQLRQLVVDRSGQHMDTGDQRQCQERAENEVLDGHDASVVLPQSPNHASPSRSG